jgi:hypothetical protein
MNKVFNKVKNSKLSIKNAIKIIKIIISQILISKFGYLYASSQLYLLEHF